MKTLEELRKIREEALQSMKVRDGASTCKIVIAMGTCGIAAGAREVMSTVLEELEKRGLTDVTVTQTGCKGLCEQEPMMDISKPGQPLVTYGYVTPEKARTIVAQHVVNDSIVGEWVVQAK
jgi:NADP-reducing hydrogenase subunit HndB